MSVRRCARHCRATGDVPPVHFIVGGGGRAPRVSPAIGHEEPVAGGEGMLLDPRVAAPAASVDEDHRRPLA